MIKAVSIMAVALLASALFAEEYILNGSFESPAHTNNDGTDPENWAVVETLLGIEPDKQIRTVARFSKDGVMSVAFGSGQSDHTGQLWQDFATIPGHQYAYSFSARLFANDTPRSTRDQHIVQMDIRNGVGTRGAVITSVTAGGLGQELGKVYTEYRGTFKAVGHSTTIHFTDKSTAPALDANDIYLDSVSISWIPEPGTFVVFVGIFAALFVGLCRRRP